MDQHDRPIGLNEIKAAVGKPSPANFLTFGKCRVVGMSGAELLPIVVDDGIYPHQFSILVHPFDEGGTG